jgi:hypothetical protein
MDATPCVEPLSCVASAVFKRLRWCEACGENVEADATHVVTYGGS